MERSGSTRPGSGPHGDAGVLALLRQAPPHNPLPVLRLAAPVGLAPGPSASGRGRTGERCHPSAVSRLCSHSSRQQEEPGECT